jgi:hypothetical protein
MAFSSLASNQMVSDTEASTGGFSLNSGQSHSSTGIMMTKATATAKYKLNAANLSSYTSNQLIPKSVWASAVIGVGVQLVETTVAWNSVCGVAWVNPVTKYTKQGLRAWDGVWDANLNAGIYYIYNDIGCTSMLQIVGKSYLALENGIYKRVAGDSHSDAIAVLTTCAAADTTAPSACSLSQSYSAPNITLTWTAATDANGISYYDLQQNIDSVGWESIYTGLTRRFTQSLDAATQNTFRVIAYDPSGNYSISNQQSRNGPASCLVEGTLISLQDGTQMPIETLMMNQLLLSTEIETLQDTNDALELYKWNSRSLQENRIASPITKIEPKIAFKTIIINQGLLEATSTHSQLIQRDGIWKFIALGDVVVGDKLYGINKEIIEITSVLVNLEKRNIYLLTLSPSHTYFANGILTHNGKVGP